MVVSINNASFMASALDVQSDGVLKVKVLSGGVFINALFIEVLVPLNSK